MNIRVRKARQGDGKGIAKSFNEALKSGFNRYTGSNELVTPRKIWELDRRYAGHRHGEIFFVAVNQDTGEIIGSALFMAKHGRGRHRGEAGWGVHPDYARHGVGTMLLSAIIDEARKRGFKRIEAEVAVENEASVILAKKCGFSIEGKRISGLILDDGTFADTYLFGQLLF